MAWNTDQVVWEKEWPGMQVNMLSPSCSISQSVDFIFTHLCCFYLFSLFMVINEESDLIEEILLGFTLNEHLALRVSYVTQIGQGQN